MLNSRNPFAQGYKSALRVASKSSWDPFVTMTHDCKLLLKDSSGQLLHSICRKSGFIGLLAAIKSAKALLHDFEEIQQAPLLYFTYVLLYVPLQSGSSWVVFLVLFTLLVASITTQLPNNSLRHIFVKKQYSRWQGVTVPNELQQLFFILMAILHRYKQCFCDSDKCCFSQEVWPTREKSNPTQNMTMQMQLTLLHCQSIREQLSPASLDMWQKMAEKQLLCMECCDALDYRSHPATTKFLAFKDRGGLFQPTNSVIKVCKETEKCL